MGEVFTFARFVRSRGGGFGGAPGQPMRVFVEAREPERLWEEYARVTGVDLRDGVNYDEFNRRMNRERFDPPAKWGNAVAHFAKETGISRALKRAAKQNPNLRLATVRQISYGTRMWYAVPVPNIGERIEGSIEIIEKGETISVPFIYMIDR